MDTFMICPDEKKLAHFYLEKSGEETKRLPPRHEERESTIENTCNMEVYFYLK